MDKKSFYKLLYLNAINTYSIYMFVGSLSYTNLLVLKSFRNLYNCDFFHFCLRSLILLLIISCTPDNAVQVMKPNFTR